MAGGARVRCHDATRGRGCRLRVRLAPPTVACLEELGHPQRQDHSLLQQPLRVSQPRDVVLQVAARRCERTECAWGSSQRTQRTPGEQSSTSRSMANASSGSGRSPQSRRVAVRGSGPLGTPPPPPPPPRLESTCQAALRGGAAATARRVGRALVRAEAPAPAAAPGRGRTTSLGRAGATEVLALCATASPRPRRNQQGVSSSGGPLCGRATTARQDEGSHALVRRGDAVQLCAHARPGCSWRAWRRGGRGAPGRAGGRLLQAAWAEALPRPPPARRVRRGAVPHAPGPRVSKPGVGAREHTPSTRRQLLQPQRPRWARRPPPARSQPPARP